MFRARLWLKICSKNAKSYNILAETQNFGLNKQFRPKQPISAGKSVSAEILVSAKISAFLVALNSVSVFRPKFYFVCPLYQSYQSYFLATFCLISGKFASYQGFLSDIRVNLIFGLIPISGT